MTQVERASRPLSSTSRPKRRPNSRPLASEAMTVWVWASSAKRCCANGRSRLTVTTTVPGGSSAIASETWWVCASHTRVSIDGTTDSTTTLPR